MTMQGRIVYWSKTPTVYKGGKPNRAACVSLDAKLSQAFFQRM